MYQLFWIVLGIFYLAFVVGLWKVFEKTGLLPGWYAIIPIWNFAQIVYVSGKSLWYAVGIVFGFPVIALWCWFVINHALALRFRKSRNYALGMILLPYIYYPILGYGPDIFSKTYERK